MLVGKPLLVGVVPQQVPAHVLDVDIAVGRDPVGLSLVGHEIGIVRNRVDLELRFLHVFIERLKVAGRCERRDHVGIDVDEIELRRTRQGFRHCSLRRVEDGDILHRSNTDARLSLELGDDRLHRHEIGRPDHSAHVGSAGSLARSDGALLHGCGKRKGARAWHEIGESKSYSAFHDGPPRDDRLKHGSSLFLCSARVGTADESARRLATASRKRARSIETDLIMIPSPRQTLRPACGAVPLAARICGLRAGLC